MIVMNNLHFIKIDHLLILMKTKASKCQLMIKPIQRSIHMQTPTNKTHTFKT